MSKQVSALQNRLLKPVFSLLVLCGSVIGSAAYGHGLKPATANIQLHPNNIVTVSVDFDLVELLNHKQHQYSLPLLSSLSQDDFSKLYLSVTKLFNEKLTLLVSEKEQQLNRHYPSAHDVQKVIKAQFIEQQMAANNASVLYTQSERRYYQRFSFDMKLAPTFVIEDVEISFPQPLGNIYVTYSEPISRQHAVRDSWRIGK